MTQEENKMTEENQNALVDELNALNLNIQELIKVLKGNKESGKGGN